MKGKSVRTLKNRKAVLLALSGGASVTATAQRTGVSKSAIQSWRNDDAVFSRECESAMDSGTDLLEDEAFRRARETSDVLLIFLLKGRRPGIYNRKTLVLEGNPDAPLQGDARIMIYPKERS
jgi:transposase-like protein